MTRGENIVALTLALPWRRLWKWAFAYAGTAALVVAAFILLHYVGNQTPYGLVAQKVVAEFEAEPMAWGTRRRDIYYPWEYCYLTGAVLAGAMPSATPLRDALTPRRLPYRTTLQTSAPNPCGALREAVGRDVGAALAARMADPASLPRLRGQQWFGSKALYAIGLRFLTVRGYHEFLRKATYVGFALFGVGLALLGWRAFVVGSPVVVFGAALSGIEYLADVGKGTPHVWGVVAPALVALWLRLREGRRGATAPATGLLCFVAGMVSAYLWLLDGANFVAAALIGLVAWLHYASLPVKARAGRAAGCMAAYAVGFLGTLLAWALGGGGGKGGGSGWSPVAKDAVRIVAPDERDLHGRDIGAWAELLPLDASETQSDHRHRRGAGNGAACRGLARVAA